MNLRTIDLWFLSKLYLLQEGELELVNRWPHLTARYAPHWPIETTVGIDVGASLGVYSLAMARWCSEVVAMEPNPQLANQLRRRSVASVRVIEAAASRESGSSLLVDDRPSGHRRPTARLGQTGAWQVPVSTVRIDQLVDLPNALIAKIDAEGHEAYVLEGMERLLSARFVLLIVELEGRHSATAWETFEWIESRGFAAYLYRGGRLMPSSADAIETAAPRLRGRFARLTGYRSNFIFLKQSDCAY